MVTTLGIDSTGAACSAAIWRGKRVVARRFAAMERGQAEALMPMVAAVLEEAALAIEALDLIAVTVGPGAFTGVRIGIAAARGLSLASGVPALGISSFVAAAAQAPIEERRGRALLVALDSRRAEFFVEMFGADDAPLGPGALLSAGEITARLPAGPLLLAGDAAAALVAALERTDLALASRAGAVDAADVAGLAARAWRPGMRPPPPEPLYLRAPDTTMPRDKVRER
ncbi:MAG TPA: tRNA (adenosine(37)-N6)-threonylcarbamoyltransferase complex dimerization subunit type 1 TsaB [Stellaceae bacterium]|nr:tRNA (adenosine(37)-N6)-threonylcarbamoyltransferase complex dimerization subunit type 1 TsaB [Stellaceae bacterium]